MPQLKKIAHNNTTITQEGGYTVVTLHKTRIVRFNEKEVILNTEGWNTATTANRMNQTANEFGLGFKVRREGGNMIVEVASTGEQLSFNTSVFFAR